jgi:hypothetical protein
MDIAVNMQTATAMIGLRVHGNQLPTLESVCSPIDKMSPPINWLYDLVT